jgi:hypothetical protein
MDWQAPHQAHVSLEAAGGRLGSGNYGQLLHGRRLLRGAGWRQCNGMLNEQFQRIRRLFYLLTNFFDCTSGEKP